LPRQRQAARLPRDLASYQVTNSELAQKLGISHSKIERRVRELLRPDPKARMQSGYTRKYSLNEAFTVYIGGYLVSELKFSIYESQRMIMDIQSWAQERGLYPYAPFYQPDEADRHALLYRIDIMRDEQGDLRYEAIGQVGREEIKEGESTLTGEKYLTLTIKPPRGGWEGKTRLSLGKHRGVSFPEPSPPEEPSSARSCPLVSRKAFPQDPRHPE